METNKDSSVIATDMINMPIRLGDVIVWRVNNEHHFGVVVGATPKSTIVCELCDREHSVIVSDHDGTILQSSYYGGGTRTHHVPILPQVTFARNEVSICLGPMKKEYADAYQRIVDHMWDQADAKTSTSDLSYAVYNKKVNHYRRTKQAPISYVDEFFGHIPGMCNEIKLAMTHTHKHLSLLLDR